MYFGLVSSVAAWPGAQLPTHIFHLCPHANRLARVLDYLVQQLRTHRYTSRVRLYSLKYIAVCDIYYP